MNGRMLKAYRLGALAPLLAIASGGAGGQAAAQGVPQRSSAPGGVLRPSATGQPPISQSVVQPVPSSDGMTLDAALGRLARDPRDIAALIDAGNAALAMGDVDAATGFFRRADQVSPGNPQVKAGLAGAMARNGDPFGAIPLFDEAEKAGAVDGALAADRGLAYDLVGDGVTAQRLYRQALARMPSDEVVRRLALSLAIAGDKHNAELILSPLLQQRNLAAWRTRAFVLAILGQTEEAVGIANTILPAELAASVAPYLRYMPRLTHAQQAAAANFGVFPRASEIGRDDPRVAQYAPKRSSVAAADAALAPQGESLGGKPRGRDRDRARDRDRDRTLRSRSTALAPSIALSGAASAPRTRDARLAPPEPPQPGRELTAAVAAAPPTAAARPALVPAPTLAPIPAPAAPAAQVAMAPKSVPAPTPSPAQVLPRNEPERAVAALSTPVVPATTPAGPQRT
ncbi:MAG TPA: SPOR domain-containing protein, partial [Allosphingosinicella sp.]|nr:SPOR domain-containing protein [Allosphingosinicella sp.]